jgi:hypothetical protein
VAKTLALVSCSEAKRPVVINFSVCGAGWLPLTAVYSVVQLLSPMTVGTLSFHVRLLFGCRSEMGTRWVFWCKLVLAP